MPIPCASRTPKKEKTGIELTRIDQIPLYPIDDPLRLLQRVAQVARIHLCGQGLDGVEIVGEEGEAELFVGFAAGPRPDRRLLMKLVSISHQQQRVSGA
jgi:hypothetical protein